MASECPTSSRLTAKPSRRPYEAPRLEVLDLRPEEQLLICLKSIPIPPSPCAGVPTIS